MTRNEKETSGAATPEATVHLSEGPIFNKEEVLGLVAGFKVDDSLLQKRHLQRDRSNSPLRKLRVLRDRFLNGDFTSRKIIGKSRKFRH
ncbi:hypothetical protein HMPREF3158_05600 [Corynebacterium sp. HMSC06G04]|uniref:hypothetical protein n=1 Tax=Corynebacterium sp. HMSC06G04 TaxID=1581126 RepID=UPI0008A426DD|nr:hypothetical protein [Corynebacterium sp. HMSC06G04]OFT47017.1 hypothetical protein HMPREF3158_05600 [Corynebacterium sp. HMSC06G04]